MHLNHPIETSLPLALAVSVAILYVPLIDTVDSQMCASCGMTVLFKSVDNHFQMSLMRLQVCTK